MILFLFPVKVSVLSTLPKTILPRATLFKTTISKTTLSKTQRLSYTSKVDHDIKACKDWLQSSTHKIIPTKEFDITYSRASGPGGQKVNKTSSKATVSLKDYRWLNPTFCYWIPDAIRHQLKHNNVRYVTKNDGLVIQSDNSRSREVNAEECFKKLWQEIKAKVYFPNEVSEDGKKKWEKLEKEHNNKRLLSKKYQSDKKKSRIKKFDV